jgi:SAM-dependent methyltransferase
MLSIVYKALGVPVVYRTYSRLIGGNDRGKFSREHVRPTPGQRVLDIGCGTADALQYLPAVDYTGFDANPDYIEAAKRSYGDRGRFYCQRVSEESLAEHAGFDVVLAVGVLHHLDDGEAEHLFRLAHVALKPGGTLVTLDPCFAEGQSPIARLLASFDRGRYVRDVNAYRRIADRVFSDIRQFVRSDFLPIPYTHLVLECTRGEGASRRR